MEASIEENLSNKLAYDKGMKMMAEKLPELIKVLKELKSKKE
jgi:hypothetical protein